MIAALTSTSTPSTTHRPRSDAQPRPSSVASAQPSAAAACCGVRGGDLDVEIARFARAAPASTRAADPDSIHSIAADPSAPGDLGERRRKSRVEPRV